MSKRKNGPSNPLAKYLERQGLSARELGKRAKVHHSTISRLAEGQWLPKPKMIRKIERATGITQRDWLRHAGGSA